ncbi:MAG: benzoyl-CoA reductase subunit C [Myxococcota bacterium]
MTRLDEILERAESLYRDIDLSAVKAWKEKKPGRKVVGYLPIYVPRELAHAAGMLSVGIVGNGQMEIIRGDAYFQSYICHLPRSVIELGVTGRLDVLDGVLFPSICDVIRNLSGMWKLLFKDKYAHYVDFPQNFDPEVGGRFYALELAHIRHDFEELSGNSIDDATLRESIEVFNVNRRSIRDLYAMRRAEPWNVPSRDVYLLMRAGHVLPVEEHTAMIDEYVSLAAERQAPERDNIRVVVAGAFCEQPPVELIQTLERAGCYIVSDDLLLGFRWLNGDVDASGEPMQALAQAYLEQSTSSASKYEVDGQNGAALVAAVRDTDADGVIFCAPSFCDPALLDQPMQVDALEKAGIPHTNFLYAENTGQFQVIREQAGTFADSIRLWSDA